MTMAPFSVSIPPALVDIVSERYRSGEYLGVVNEAQLACSWAQQRGKVRNLDRTVVVLEDGSDI